MSQGNGGNGRAPMDKQPGNPSSPSAIISAYAVYPLPNTAEGVVNAALLDVLSARTQNYVAHV